VGNRREKKNIPEKKNGVNPDAGKTERGKGRQLEARLVTIQQKSNIRAALNAPPRQKRRTTPKEKKKET